MKNIVILISGSGSNMAAIIRTAEEHNWSKRLNARVSAVISNKADAEGLAFAKQHGITTAVVDHKAGDIDPVAHPGVQFLEGLHRLLALTHRAQRVAAGQPKFGVNLIIFTREPGRGAFTIKPLLI